MFLGLFSEISVSFLSVVWRDVTWCHLPPVEPGWTTRCWLETRRAPSLSLTLNCSASLRTSPGSTKSWWVKNSSACPAVLCPSVLPIALPSRCGSVSVGQRLSVRHCLWVSGRLSVSHWRPVIVSRSWSARLPMTAHFELLTGTLAKKKREKRAIGWTAGILGASKNLKLIVHWQ